MCYLKTFLLPIHSRKNMLPTKKRPTTRKGRAKQTTQLSMLVDTLVHYSIYPEHMCLTSAHIGPLQHVPGTRVPH